jgi:signal transduction histidine kinase
MSEVKDLERQIEQLRTQIQKSEKLSSLGTLSAGIAHEIQNPLNFVINFSQMANDMVDDLTDILDEKGLDLEDEANEELADVLSTLRSYLSKIAEHGHRATDIIQGILMYSRGKADEFLPTNIQKFLKKYVWLSFHAMRANLADFNVTIHEEYDPAIPEVMVIPQDLSRAVINVMNNACYAVWKRQKASGDDYSPVITIKAILKGDNFEIWIEDNGTGMSEEVREHLFTAFFTTKPVGEGTGLGLSITREIIEDKHHGKIEVESEENKFTRFVFIIPVKR